MEIEKAHQIRICTCEHPSALELPWNAQIVEKFDGNANGVLMKKSQKRQTSEDKLH